MMNNDIFTATYSPGSDPLMPTSKVRASGAIGPWRRDCVMHTNHITKREYSVNEVVGGIDASSGNVDRVLYNKRDFASLLGHS